MCAMIYDVIVRSVIPTVWRINLYGMSYTNVTNLEPLAWSVPKCDGVERCNAQHIPKYFGTARLLF